MLATETDRVAQDSGLVKLQVEHPGQPMAKEDPAGTGQGDSEMEEMGGCRAECLAWASPGSEKATVLFAGGGMSRFGDERNDRLDSLSPPGRRFL